MSALDFLAVTTGGMRSALVLLAVMVLIVLRHAPSVDERAERYRWATTTMFAVSAVTFSPMHAAALLGFDLPPILIRAADMGATLVGCAAFIMLLASRAIQRGVPMFRVRRAMLLNASIVASFVLVAWSSR